MSGRALVFQRDPVLQGLVFALLERQGLSVTAAKDVGEALTADHGRFDVFIVDLTSGAPSDYELLQHLRGCRNDGLHCIVLIAPGSKAEVLRELGGEAGFRILEQPFELRQFEQAVQGCVRRGGPEPVRIQCLSCEQEQAFAAPSEDEARELARSQGWRVVTFVRQDQPFTQWTHFVTVCPGCTAAVST